MTKARHVLLFLCFICVIGLSLTSFMPVGVGQTSYTTVTSTSTSTISTTISVTRSVYTTSTISLTSQPPGAPSGGSQPGNTTLMMIVYLVAAVALIAVTIQYTKRKTK